MLKLSKLDILKQLYQQILIPRAVYSEIEKGKHKSYYQDLAKIDWFKIIDIKDKQAIKYFLDLDAGEAEAIILATEANADLIIMDEQLGRFHAKHADLKVTGTIGVLLKAKQESLIGKIKPLLIELTEKEVWLSEHLIRDVLKLSGED